MPLLVINGAKLQCTGCPGALSQLQTSSPIGVAATSICMQVASITDHAPLVNIVPFASCSLRGGNPCLPATPAPWEGSCFGPPILGLAPVLTDAHVLSCAQGGLIRILDPGQQSIEVGDLLEPEPEPDDDEPGFLEELWDDGWLIADVAMVAADILTVPSGEAIAGIAARRTLRRGIKQAIKREARPKPGSSGGPGAGKRFSAKVKDQAEQEAGGRCVFCDIKTTRKPGPTQRNTDHAIARSQGGNNTIDNAQNTCRTCNLRKGIKSTEEFLTP